MCKTRKSGSPLKTLSTGTLVCGQAFECAKQENQEVHLRLSTGTLVCGQTFKCAEQDNQEAHLRHSPLAH